MLRFKNLSFLFVVSIALSCHNQGDSTTKSDSVPSSIVKIDASASLPSDGKLPVIKFTDSTFDFGTIHQGDKVFHSYTFENKGKADLVISSADGSCSCTGASAPKDIIHPGQSNKIDVSLDSKGIQGKVVKLVYVKTNCVPNTSYLTFTANILPKTN